MKTYAAPSGIISLCVLLTILTTNALAQLEIRYPPDSSIVLQKHIQLVGITKEPGPLEVKTRNLLLLDELPLTPVTGGFSLRLKLKPGWSKVTLRSTSGLTESLNLYYDKTGESPIHWSSHRHQPEFNECMDCHKLENSLGNFQRMAMGENSCSTSRCHVNFSGEAAIVHGPVAGKVCIACHSPHGSFQPGGVLRKGKEQCLLCHEELRDLNYNFPHTPFEEGNCIGCHDPHQSDYPFQLRATGQNLCFLCHDQTETTGSKFIHEPVASGDCTICHHPHGTNFPSMLFAEGNDLCLECHEEKISELARQVPHEPVNEDCTNCHDPHTSDSDFQLYDDVPVLCWMCHSDLEEQVDLANIPHQPVSEGACSKCHQVHGSENSKLLLHELPTLCTECHTEIRNKLNSSSSQHGPVRDGDCIACHQPHGSPNPKILVEYFPPNFYNRYTENLYNLCFQCHNADIAKDPQTSTLTNFRDGSRNLHYVHVNKKKGRSCKACHEVHASNQSMHIRHTVPFGKLYEYSIQFTPTKDGGGCLVGCHKERHYSRIKAINGKKSSVRE